MSISIRYIVHVRVTMFLAGQVEACTISHMHFETARSKTLCLRLLNARYLFFGVADRTIVLLRVLLHQLVLKWRLVVKLLAIRSNS